MYWRPYFRDVGSHGASVNIISQDGLVSLMLVSRGYGLLSLTPLIRAMQHVAAWCCNGVWHQVLTELVLADDEGSVGRFLQLVRSSVGRKRYPYTFAGKPLTHELDRRSEIAIAGDNDSRVKTVIVAVRKKLGGDVHVSHLLLVLGPGGTTLVTLLRLGEVVPKVGRQLAEGGESIQPGILAASVLAVPTAIPNPIRKVVAVLKSLMAIDNARGCD